MEIQLNWGLDLVGERWGCHLPNYLVGFLPRRKCVSLWSVSMRLVKLQSCINSSWERLSPPFLPSVCGRSQCNVVFYWFYQFCSSILHFLTSIEFFLVSCVLSEVILVSHFSLGKMMMYACLNFLN